MQEKVKIIDALTIRKCCNEDEVLNDLRVCVKPGSEKVPMPILKKQTNKHIGVVGFIRQKFTKFVNKHTNFTGRRPCVKPVYMLTISNIKFVKIFNYILHFQLLIRGGI